MGGRAVGKPFKELGDGKEYDENRLHIKKSSNTKNSDLAEYFVLVHVHSLKYS